MLSILPELLFLAPLGLLALRLSLALLFLYAAWNHLSGRDGLLRVFAVLEALVAALFIGGAWTQPAALGGILVAATWLTYPRMNEYARSTALLTLVIAATLVVSGPGAFAFDLPL